MTKWKRHAASAAYPDMENDEWEGLLADIQENGLRDPVVMHDGMVLDGWHRVQACQAAKIEIKAIQYEGDDPGGFVISKNGHRRHNLTQSQKAAAAITVRDILPRGRPTAEKGTPGVPLNSIAAEAGVSVSTLKDANTAKQAGNLDEVRSGKKSAKQAAKDARSNGAQPDSPQPSKLELLQQRNSELEQRVRVLTDELQSVIDLTDEQLDWRTKFDQLRNEKRVLESQLNECKQKYTMILRENKAMQKKLGQ